MTPSGRAAPSASRHIDRRTAGSLEQGSIRLTSAALDARRLTQTLARYRAPNPTRSIVELVITAGPLVALWILMWVTLDLGYWPGLLLAVPAAGFKIGASDQAHLTVGMADAQ